MDVATKEPPCPKAQHARGLSIEETEGEGQTIIRERGPDGYLIHKYERLIFGDLDGLAIWPYREEPDFLLDRILDLEKVLSTDIASTAFSTAINSTIMRR